MCGISGLLGAEAGSNLANIIKPMCDRLALRGPDDAGIWTDDDSGIALGHRRLAVVDLSPAGHQPMVSATGRYVIVFNGEIYNHLNLRRELEKEGAQASWRGHSDTETLLAAFEAWGVEKTLKTSTGMFAIALWDRSEKVLTLARDRLGEKPLYYGWQHGTLLFASELKAIKAYSGFSAEVNREALPLLLRHNCIPAPYSIYKGINKLPPGTFLQVSTVDARDQDHCANEKGRVKAYWSLTDVVGAGLMDPFEGSDADAVSALDGVLRNAINQQMAADVPLGAFLSGGVDSSTVVALMQAQSMRAIQSFSIGFDEEGSNEAEHAKEVARHLGTNHTELYVTSEDALGVIPSLPTLYDEPFSDSSQIPTFLVAQMARQHVTVSLSGDAGDELFGGYNRYVLTNELWGKLSRTPMGIRRLLAHSIRVLSPTAWERLLGPLQHLIPNALKLSNVGDKLHKGAAIMTAGSTTELYRRVTSHWNEPENVVVGAGEPMTVLTDPQLQLPTDSFVHRMMLLDMLSYLPDDILCKVDRAAMGVSLETRMPLLDPGVIDFAWRLPFHMKIRDGQGKWILREVLYQYVPKKIIERPKMGFAVPIGSWLRGPLRDWAESLLDESRLEQEGYFHAEPIRQKFEEHLSGRRNWETHLWDVLMFQAWLEKERAA